MGGNRKKCRIAKMLNRHFFLFCGQGKNVELEKIFQFDIFVLKFRKGKNVELYILKGKMSNSNFKKGKNVEQKGKMSNFQNFYSTFFPQ